jgi:hypothetical protein
MAMLSDAARARSRELAQMTRTREGVEEIHRLYYHKYQPSRESMHKGRLSMKNMILKIVEAEFTAG